MRYSDIKILKFSSIANKDAFWILLYIQLYTLFSKYKGAYSIIKDLYIF